MVSERYSEPALITNALKMPRINRVISKTQKFDVKKYGIVTTIITANESRIARLLPQSETSFEKIEPNAKPSTPLEAIAVLFLSLLPPQSFYTVQTSTRSVLPDSTKPAHITVSALVNANRNM